ncbi:MAG TPA: nitroreductase family deazaflavin-dependent oxidoreductase [Ktedonobacterales bacterium]|nr:nitroreductase family deazaflavin-dependent oxidoreductase [Ktedonobacterales bacterium]
MATTLHRTFADRVNDALITTLLRAGVKMGTASLLTVRGRKSGQPHTVPVLLVERDGQRWLVAPYGVVQWVRNIRAAGRAALTRGRRSEAITVTELSAQEAAPILKQYLVVQHAADIRAYFGATKDSPLEAFEREAARHPVFKITTVEERPERPQYVGV